VVVFNRALSQDEIKQIMKGMVQAMAVLPSNKLATKWGAIKIR